MKGIWKFAMLVLAIVVAMFVVHVFYHHNGAFFK